MLSSCGREISESGLNQRVCAQVPDMPKMRHMIRQIRFIMQLFYVNIVFSFIHNAALVVAQRLMLSIVAKIVLFRGLTYDRL